MFPPGLADCCGCFLSCPGDMEKAVHTFGQMPNGLSGQFSSGRAQFVRRGSADLCGMVLAPSWPVRAWGLCCPRAPAGCPSQELGVEGLEAVKQCLRSTSNQALLSVWKSHFQTSLRLRPLRVLIQHPGLAAARGGGRGQGC